MRLPVIVLLALASLVAGAASADVVIERPWTRAVPPVSANGAAYLHIVNTGSEPDRLLGAASPTARMVHLHETRIEEGVARMGMVGELLIAPGERVELAPGGLHLMVMGLEQPLAEGDTLALRLQFERAGELDVDVPVLAPDADGPP